MQLEPKDPGGGASLDVELPGKKLDVIHSLLDRERGPVVVALQEVTPGYARSLTKLGLEHSLTYRPPGALDGGSRKLGVGLLVSSEVVVAKVGIVERAPFPDRTLVADLQIGDNTVHVLAFHSLTGVGYKAAKQAQFRSLAEHLVEQAAPTVFVGDANEPWVDAKDPEDIVCAQKNGDRGEGAGFLFGPRPKHSLVDAWRHAPELDLDSVPEDGPLAISYVRGRTPCRYDHIYIPATWNVIRMQYDMARGKAAGSDHAVVEATIELG